MFGHFIHILLNVWYKQYFGLPNVNVCVSMTYFLNKLYSSNTCRNLENLTFQHQEARILELEPELQVETHFSGRNRTAPTKNKVTTNTSRTTADLLSSLPD